MENNRRGWALVFLLFLAYLLSFLDRQIIALMIDPIKRDLGVSDFQFSLLHGLGFGVFFALFGIPIAIAADRFSRTRIVAGGIALWSAMTVWCGLARSYAGLFIGRIGVGVGEAALAPAAYSLLSDSFDQKRLPRAMAVFSMGSTLGSGLAFVLGGAILAWLATWDRAHIAWLSGFADWQLAFWVAGVPGLLLVWWVARFPEPSRQGLLQGGSAPVPFRHAFAFLWQRKRLYVGLFGAIAAMTAVSSGFIVWTPSLLIRVYGYSATEAGRVFGLLFMVCATAGVIVGGWAVSAVAARRGQAAYIAVMSTAMVGALLVLVPVAWVNNPQGLLVCLGAGLFFIQSLAGVCVTAVQLVTPNDLRAQASSYFLLFVNLLGYSLGAPIVAALTDYLYGDPLRLGWSLSTTTLVLVPLALICLALAAKPYCQASVYVRGGADA